MQADKLISSTIIPLHPQDSGERAIELMNQFRINHLPVVRDDFFLGVISDREIEKLISDRNDARGNKKFDLADEIRGKLLRKGIVLEDLDGKTIWKKKS